MDRGYGGRRRRAPWPRALGLSALLVATDSCADLFGPGGVDRPELERIEIGLALGSGFITVDGFPVDHGFRLGYGQRLPVDITTSSGDRERAELYRRYCPTRVGYGVYDCFRFDVMLRNGASIEDLPERVAAIGGRLVLYGVCSDQGCWWGGSLVTVVLFSPDHLINTARRVREWPGVQIVDLHHTGVCPFGGCSPLPYWELTVPVPATVGAAVAGDGVVQVSSGDTLVALYRQPSGSTLSVRQPVH